MAHLTDSQLRAHLDGQLEHKHLEHLATCAQCGARLETIRSRADRAAATIAALAPIPGEAPRPANALARFTARAKQRQIEKESYNMQTMLTARWRPALLGLAAVLLTVALLNFSPVRGAFSAFLGLFRVQQIAVVPVDTTSLSALNNDETLAKQIGQLFSDSMTVTKDPGQPQAVASAAEASRLAGFNVRLSSESATAPQITVQDSAAFNFVVNRSRAQAILDESGRSDLQLPASLDGANISVYVPAGVAAAYGTCPNISAEDPEEIPWNRLRHCTLLAQTPSPTVTTPPELDVTELAMIGLQFTGMTESEARAFSQTVDWTTTLVVPIPRNGHEYSQVTVDGVTGNLIYRVADDGVPPRYTLLWVKEGIIYAISGFDDPEVGLAIGDSLK